MVWIHVLPAYHHHGGHRLGVDGKINEVKCPSTYPNWVKFAMGYEHETIRIMVGVEAGSRRKERNAGVHKQS
jgi:hypothetical protein